jgi:hypothetical protein
MRRTSLVLAVVAAMMTVLVFAAPAFAVGPSLPVASDPAGPPENSGPPGGKAVDPKAPAGTIGRLASETAVADATVHGAPPVHHVIADFGVTPGEFIQLCRDRPEASPLCTP